MTTHDPPLSGFFIAHNKEKFMPSSPVIAAGQVASNMTFTEVFADEFEGTGPGPGPHWGYDPMSRALNRTGNSGQRADGSLSDGESVEGKRWAAWANGNNDELVYRENGILKMRGLVEQVNDPTRVNYTHNGIDYNWADVKAYAPYMVQWHRMYSQEANNGAGGQITDPSYPDIFFGPGHMIECRLSVEQMRTMGFRVSLWLTPHGENASNAYDNDTANGVEMDIFEIENWIQGGYGNNRIQSKVLGGASGSTVVDGGGNVDLSAYNLNQGFHTVSMLWLSTGLYWFIDGVEYIRDLDNVPQVNHFMSLTRELNAGVKDANEADANDIPSDHPKIPVDVGLFNVSSYPQLDDLHRDIAQIDYVRVWSVDGENGFFNGPSTTGGGTGTGSTSTPIGTTTQGSIEAPPEAVAGVSFTLRAPLPTFANGSVANPDDYTFLWSVPTGIEIQGPSDQYECTMVMSNDIGIGERALRVPTCDVNPIDGGTPFTFNIRVTST